MNVLTNSSLALTGLLEEIVAAPSSPAELTPLVGNCSGASSGSTYLAQLCNSVLCDDSIQAFLPHTLWICLCICMYDVIYDQFPSLPCCGKISTVLD